MPSSGFSGWQKRLFCCPAGNKPVWLWWSLGVAAAACGVCELSLAAPRLYKEPQWQIQSDPLRASTEAHRPSRTQRVFFPPLLSWFAVVFSVESGRRTEPGNKTMKERRNTQPLVVRCKLVLVGDVQCGKTAMLQVLAKDCYPEVIPEKNTSKYMHNFACVCCGLDFVKTFKDGRRVRAHFADKSCAISQYFTLLISTRKYLIHAFTVTPERPLLT